MHTSPLYRSRGKGVAETQIEVDLYRISLLQFLCERLYNGAQILFAGRPL